MIRASNRSRWITGFLALSYAGFLGCNPPAGAQSAVYVHTATAGNTATDLTLLDHSLLNNSPTSRLMVTQLWNPPGVPPVYNASPIQVFYSPLFLSWVVQNLDGSSPLGASFFVYARKDYDANAGILFVHRSSDANTSGNYTHIDHDALNGNPAAITQVTALLSSSVENPHPIGLWYDSNANRWGVFNQDLAAMPVDSKFFICAGNCAATFDVESHYLHTATDLNSSGESTHSDLTDPDLLLLVSPIWTAPGQLTGVYNDHPTGVWYDPLLDDWAVFNEDEADMPLGAHFHIFATRVIYENGFEHGLLTGWSAVFP